MNGKLEIKCHGARNLPLAELHVLQKNLKDLSKENYERLKNEMLKDGYSEPMGVWRDDEESKWWILSGTQRFRTLSQMGTEGVELPESFPVTVIEADDLKQAKRKILALASQYGNMTDQGLYDFVIEGELDPNTLNETFDFADLDLDKWAKNFFETSITEAEGATELNPNDFSNFDHQCPRCNFHFNDPNT